jgi:N-acyl-D-glutamate deacylase
VSTLIPAQILDAGVPQMKKKGRLQLGMDADVIVFDAVKVQDRATYVNPSQPSVGDEVRTGQWCSRDFRW